MAERRPLVLINGNISELPNTDKLWGDDSLASRVDFVGDNIIYKGEAEPGTLTSASAWRIKKIEFIGADEDVETTFADGNGDFDKIWNNRLSYTYS